MLDTARELLQHQSLDELALTDVAAAAQIPKSSAYHFFADLNALYAELTASQDMELQAMLAQPLPSVKNWQKIVRAIIDRAAAFFRANRSAQQLMLGPTTPPNIKRSSRSADQQHGAVIAAQIRAQFDLSPFPSDEKIFFRAVEIIDLMFSLSLLEYNELRDDMIDESGKAAIAYLSIYLPAELPKIRRRPRSQDGGGPG